MAQDIGTGSTIVFGTSSWTPQIIDINWNGIERDSIPTSIMSTVGGRTFIPSDSYDGGELVIEIAWDPDEPPPIVFNGPTVPETVTLTFPVPSGGSVGAKLAATMFIRSLDIHDPWEERMTGTLTLKVSGNITQTDHS